MSKGSHEVQHSNNIINKKPSSGNEECARSCKCRIPKLVELFKRLSNKVMHVISGRRRFLNVSSAERPKQFVPPTNDSHRTEAVEDCIKFINSSSSIRRSDSVLAETR